MRVVAGVAGGQRLQAPPGRHLRPTTDRVKEAIFAMLGSLEAIEGRTVLDLFAGTGALGIEALSRGARAATFVDSDPAAVAVVKANLKATGLAAQATVVRQDVLRWLQGVSEERFDVALADPPYAFDRWDDVLARLPADLVVLESGQPIDPGPHWATVRSRRYGDSVVTVARRL